MPNIFETDLDKNKANYTPLSPLSFLARAAYVYPAKTSVVHGERRYTWAQTFTRCRQLASALTQQGLGLGDTVSVMGFNTPETYEAHFGVPMMGGVLHAINTRLDAKNVAFMLGHAETKVLITDRTVSAVIGEALELAEQKPLVIDIDDKTVSGGDLLGVMDYEAFLATGDPEFEWQLPADEWQAISLNYTSGTTGNPKGVVYHHRGAYLNATSNIVGWELPKHPVYLWTLPMFHCNGWCFPWTMAAVGGTNVCLRQVGVDAIYDAIGQEGITHYCGAPIVHQMIAMAPDELKEQKTGLIKGMVAGAPPPAAVLASMAESGFEVTHVYGLTETYGPAVICDWDPAWNGKTVAEQAEINARQGVRYHMLEDLIVANPETLEPVPADGQTMGEVLFRGNVVMKGYLKNPTASLDAFDGGWFRSGDLAVLHPDGYIELRDRSKDIIISGGENISTIEVEGAIFKHPAVMDAAVVAMPHEKWGETPCAFVALKEGYTVTEAEIIEFVQGELARFKAPRRVIFGPIPKTSTGKTQKYVLRDSAKMLE
ncbi:MAG: fatty-acyl-CoA synthase [Cellvibrionaceae bacterium]|jgi:fatty-acyl-CoA synthase